MMKEDANITLNFEDFQKMALTLMADNPDTGTTAPYALEAPTLDNSYAVRDEADLVAMDEAAILIVKSWRVSRKSRQQRAQVMHLAGERAPQTAAASPVDRLDVIVSSATQYRYTTAISLVVSGARDDEYMCEIDDEEPCFFSSLFNNCGCASSASSAPQSSAGSQSDGEWL
jgi:hypothetical protein